MTKVNQYGMHSTYIPINNRTKEMNTLKSTRFDLSELIAPSCKFLDMSVVNLGQKTITKFYATHPDFVNGKVFYTSTPRQLTALSWMIETKKLRNMPKDFIQNGCGIEQ